MLDAHGHDAPIPGDDYVLPFGEARCVRAGEELTVVSWGAMVERCELAAAEIASMPRSSICARWRPGTARPCSTPWRSTRRCLIVHEDKLTAGFGAEIAATLAQEAFFDLDAPIERLAMPDIPSPALPAAARRRVAERGSASPRRCATRAAREQPLERERRGRRGTRTERTVRRHPLAGAALVESAWAKRVAKNEPLIEVETDKVTVEIPGARRTASCGEILKQPQEVRSPRRAARAHRARRDRLSRRVPRRRRRQTAAPVGDPGRGEAHPASAR